MRAIVVLAALFTASHVYAGTWSEHISFRHSEKTSVKVTEPDGFKVTVAATDGDHAGVVPEVFDLPDRDAFVKVTIVSADGATWTKKIEVRAGQQTEVAVSYAAEATAPGGKARTFVGKVAHLGRACGKQWAVQIKAEILRHADGGTVTSWTLKPDDIYDLELAAGSYDVRVYKRSGDDWAWAFTGALSVDKDGWESGVGCRDGKPVIGAKL